MLPKAKQLLTIDSDLLSQYLDYLKDYNVIIYQNQILLIYPHYNIRQLLC